MSLWTTEPRPYTSWGLDRSGSTQRRLTENGLVRVTEQSVIRIIERFDAMWSKEISPVNLWTKE
jgi:hypothetical protein